MLGHAKALACAAAVAACGGVNHTALAQSQNQSGPFTITELANFEVPWSMAFLPDGALLVTEQKGALKLRSANGTIASIAGVPR
jgi:glucose/arabinose dehydrogenase